MQISLGVLKLQGVVSQVAGYALQLGSLAQHDADGPVTGGAARIRIEDVLPQLGQRPDGSGVGEIRSELASFTADTVAPATAGLSPEDLRAGIRVAWRNVLDGRRRQGAHERHYLPEFILLQTGGGHATGGNAAPDDVIEDVLIHRMPIDALA